MNQIKAVGQKYQFVVDGDTITITTNKKDEVFHAGPLSSVQTLFFRPHGKFSSGEIFFILEGKRIRTNEMFSKEDEDDFIALFECLTAINPCLNLSHSQAISYRTDDASTDTANQSESNGIPKKPKRRWLTWVAVIFAFVVVVNIFTNDDDDEPAEPVIYIVEDSGQEAEQEPEPIPEPTPEPVLDPIDMDFETLWQNRDWDTLLRRTPVISDPLNNAEAYLALLTVVSEFFPDLHGCDEIYDKTDIYNIREPVQLIMDYRVDHNRIPEAFQESFGLFWSVNDFEDHPEIKQSLTQTFNLVFRPPARGSIWVPSLTWDGEPIIFSPAGGVPTDSDIPVDSDVSANYVRATRRNLYSGVRVYLRTADFEAPPADMDNASIVIAWGNIGSPMEEYVFVDWGQGWQSWEHYTFFTTDFGGFGTSVIKIDDPALARAERTFRATEADNFRLVTMYDLTIGVARLDIRVLTGGARLYSLDSMMGTMSHTESFIDVGDRTYMLRTATNTRERMNSLRAEELVASRNRFVRR